MTIPRWSRLEWAVLVLLFVSFVARILLTLHRQLNVDEFQHLHASWMIHLGYLPYTDFWENHSPLLYFLTAPLLSALNEGATSLLIVRMIHSIAGLAIIGLVYSIARLDYCRTTALLAVLVLSVSEIFLQKTIEIRTDQFLVLCWLISLWICFRKGRPTKDLIAGFVLGIGMLFSPKAMICFIAAAITIYIQQRSPSLKMLKRQLFLFAGFLIPVVSLGLYCYSLGIFRAWIDSTIFQNLSYPDTRGPTFLLLPQNIGFLLLGFAGMILSLRDHNLRAAAVHKTPALLMIPGIVLLCILIFFMPSTFSQSALTFVPIFAIYAGFAVKRSLELKRIPLLAFAILTGLIIPVVSLLMRVYTTPTNHSQRELIRYILTHTTRDEPIFDGNTAYVFRKQGYHYGSLVEGIRYKIERDEISDGVIETLKRKPCRVLLYDDRVSDLPQPIQDFLRANYIPTGYDNVFVAGKHLDSQNLAENKAVFWIELPLKYSIQASNEQALRIDGQRYRNPLFLSKGLHHLLSDRQLHQVTIRAEKP